MTTPRTQLQSTGEQGNKVKVVAGYALQQRLGAGSFATVYKGVKVKEGDERAAVAAIKAITRGSEKLTKKVLDNLEMEIAILRTYRHPNIVCLHDVQKTERHFYLILEYCGGGDVQRLIRTRKTGRLTERLARRLMRDLTAGLQFLWSQELIHRDIKPQNLLLTGPLPLDEIHDPAKMEVHEEMRRKANFPSSQFALKIADFGFARHLQTASLAETLCGSPLYMAPEILQHHRYDAKADLWSVGTVLFEMIAGKPPFNGENHIDLLRNIQRKAVRLPADVRVSKECVNLLRILLNRNPLSRAGFKEYFKACEAFVALGCEGEKQTFDTPKQTQRPSVKMDLGTIDENTPGAASLVTVATQAPQQLVKLNETPQMTNEPFSSAPVSAHHMTTPPFGAVPSPPSAIVSPSAEMATASTHVMMQHINPVFTPLQPSPPQYGLKVTAPIAPPFDSRALQQRAMEQTPTIRNQPVDLTAQTPQDSCEGDSGFVMVERSLQRSDISVSPSIRSPNTTTNTLIRAQSSRSRVSAPSPTPSSPNFLKPPMNILSDRGDSLSASKVGSRRSLKGILSTSPSTGRALVGFLSGRHRILSNASHSPSNVGVQIDEATKTVAAAEDVGRRAITLAHLGDTRAFIAMKMVATSGNSSMLSVTPMEGVEEEDDEHSSADVTDDGGSSNSTQIMGRRRSVSITDRSMPDIKDDGEEGEMPFAIVPDGQQKCVSFTPLPSRSSSNDYNKKSSLSSSSRPSVKPTPELIRGHLSEALSCYLKALSLLKGVLGAVQKVKKDIDFTLAPTPVTTDQGNRIHSLSKRCDVTGNWLSSQFSGILERAEAANAEIAKVPTQSHEQSVPHLGVKELIYNHAMACGRDGAVKQLLGQTEAARSCYRNAGLLAETLLMEPGLTVEDRRILEEYVDRFSARITELDKSILHQSRSTNSSGGNSAGQPRRGSSGVIGLIGFDSSSPQLSLK